MTYRHTLYASYLGYITQAICNNLPPLLFVTFNERFGRDAGAARLLVSINFFIQMAAICSPPAMWTASATAAPWCWRRRCPRWGLCCWAFCLCACKRLCRHPPPHRHQRGGRRAVGGAGQPHRRIAARRAQGKGNEGLLHSFYCWGHVAVVLLSTAYFALAGGVDNWRYLPFLCGRLAAFERLFVRQSAHAAAAGRPRAHAAEGAVFPAGSSGCFC